MCGRVKEGWRVRRSCFRPNRQQYLQTNEHPTSIVRSIGTARTCFRSDAMLCFTSITWNLSTVLVITYTVCLCIVLDPGPYGSSMYCESSLVFLFWYTNWVNPIINVGVLQSTWCGPFDFNASLYLLFLILNISTFIVQINFLKQICSL